MRGGGIKGLSLLGGKRQWLEYYRMKLSQILRNCHLSRRNSKSNSPYAEILSLNSDEDPNPVIFGLPDPMILLPDPN